MQNTNLIIAVVGLFLVFVTFFIYKKSKKTSVRTLVDDPNNAEPFNKENNKKNLSLNDRVELSWKFLYEITELIISKFSKKDVELVNKLGHILLDNGMRYEHVVDLGIKQQAISRVASIEQQAYSQSQKTLGK
ncbi:MULTISPECIES: DUF2660 domain-containing protein [unclassified Candidatus Tisiphia]|jgi:hypothetical protein|uniref:DUF2660 domain-containing protein n=1 Tax=unclassified Candidatus Tisiphia TaxID=2996318 RepID=UPI002838FC8E|nr:DUF2660 domain-containing protein [Rickettsiaceae bacterium]MDD9337113.1 DUF2660 domain-containing protein [Rickettsiaceae bacterium]MDR0329162.1 DUF2660 domain-containing protein [Rickettsia sp.]